MKNSLLVAVSYHIRIQNIAIQI